MLEKLLNSFIQECMQESTAEEITAPRITIILEKDAFTSLSEYLFLHKEESETALDRILSELVNMDLLKSCCAAYICSRVIRNTGATDTDGCIVDRFYTAARNAMEYLKKLSKLKQEEPDMTQDEIYAYLLANAKEEMMGYIGCNTAALAVKELIQMSRETKEQFRLEASFDSLFILQQYCPNIREILRIYTICSHLPLTVICPQTMRGILAEADDIANNFHLFFLLEAELYREDLENVFQLKNYTFSQEIYDCATGKAEPDPQMMLQVHQQYYTYQALVCDNSYDIAQGYKLDPKTSLIWGEAVPDQIPRFENRAVILMDCHSMFGSRRFAAGFLQKSDKELNPNVYMERELSQEEVLELLVRIKKHGSDTMNQTE